MLSALRPRGAILSRYLLRAHAGPFLFSIVTLMFLFLLQFVMKFIDQLVGKGLSAWVIMELVVLNLAWILVLVVPMSVLVAVLMAFGDLAARNEITVMRASGVSTYRLLAPVLLAGAIVAALMTWFNNVVYPESNYRLKTLTVDIRRKKPTLTLVNGVFNQDIPGYSILVKKTFEQSNDLEGVTLYDHRDPARNVTITARMGRISFSQDYRKLILDLRDGEVHELDLRNIAEYRRIRFDSLRKAMDVEGFDFERSSASAFSRGDRELGAPAMLVIVDSLRDLQGNLAATVRTTMREEAESLLSGSGRAPPQRGTLLRAHDSRVRALARARELSSTVSGTLFRIESLERQAGQYMVEVHKKYSIPAACLVFVLVGVPLGIMARRGGFGIAATLSLGFFVLYWACLIGGEKLADRGILSPFLGMWGANFLIGALGIYLTVQVARENVLIRWDFLTRLLPRRWRRSLALEQQGEPG
jgi:lipopolysaccharide export system permease protein